MTKHYPFGKAEQYNVYRAVGDFHWLNCAVATGDQVLVPMNSYASLPRWLEPDREAHPIEPAEQKFVPERSPRIARRGWWKFRRKKRVEE